MSFPTTITQKVIADGADKSNVEVGEFLTVNINLAFAHNGSSPRRWQPYIDRLSVGILAEGDIYILRTNGNSQGRMCHVGANAYLASPYTVATAAVTEHIVNPSSMLGGS